MLGVVEVLDWFFSVEWVRRVLFVVGGGLRRRVLDYLCGVGVVGFNVLLERFGGGYRFGGFKRWVLQPLLDAGLVVVGVGGVRVSDVGRGVCGFLKVGGVPGVFSRSSRGYEVVVVLELDKRGFVDFKGLRELVPVGSLRRVLGRLSGFIIGERVGGGWVGVGEGVVDGLAGRVLDVVRGGVVSASRVASVLGVNRRSVYKCLNRLKRMGLVASVKGGLVYLLNDRGVELAGYLKGLLGCLRGLVDLDVGVGLQFLKCLVERGYPVSEREIVEVCFKGRVDLDRLGFIRESLKRLGLVVGNLYTGYTVSRVFWDMVKNK